MAPFGDLIRSVEWWGAARLSDASAASGNTGLRRSFDDYYKAGIEAFRTGDLTLAHDLWREAATVDPYQERVWVALLRVLTTPDDRRVCLENILAINPGNARARREMAALERAATEKKRRRIVLPLPVRFILAVFRGLLIGLLATGIGIGVSIITYGHVLQTIR